MNPTAEAVIAIVAADPGIPRTEIARRVGITKERVRQILIAHGMPPAAVRARRCFCGDAVQAAGLCRRHSHAIRRYGDPFGAPESRPIQSPDERRRRKLARTERTNRHNQVLAGFAYQCAICEGARNPIKNFAVTSATFRYGMGLAVTFLEATS